MNDAAWGLQMAVLGMGLVFGLLSLLWGLLTLVQRLERGAGSPAAAQPRGDGRASDAGTGDAGAAPPLQPTEGDVAAAQAPAFSGVADGLDDASVAAIVTAVLAHRAVLRREAAPAMRRYSPGSLLYASRWLGTGRARQNDSWQRKGR